VNPGDLLILLTAVSYAYLIVYLAEVAGRHDVRWFSAGQIVAATLFVGAARLLAMPFLGRVSWLEAEARPLPSGPGLWAAVLWMSLMATVVTFLVQTWAQARMTATHAAIIFALEPVFTAIFAAIVLGERMAGKDWAGASLVLLGILVSELPSRR
jgi:drug/metabolite transporter (DMT)-like permease